jgi:ligand-binding SRPBCC domain-containing protein
VKRMKIHVLMREQRLTGSPGEVFPLFADARNLERITPPFLTFRVLTPGAPAMRAGTELDYQLRLHGLPLRWRTRIEVWDPPRRFADRQLAGPFRLWHHTHDFEPDGDGTRMRDLVRYALPLGPAGAAAHAAFVRQDLARIFDFRRVAVEQLVERSGAAA